MDPWQQSRKGIASWEETKWWQAQWFPVPKLLVTANCHDMLVDVVSIEFSPSGRTGGHPKHKKIATCKRLIRRDMGADSKVRRGITPEMVLAVSKAQLKASKLQVYPKV